MLLLSSGADQSRTSPLLQRIEEAALQLYRRPYLPRGVPERTLILLCSLLQRTDPSGTPNRSQVKSERGSSACTEMC